MNQTVSNYKHETALLSPFDMGRRTLARALPPWWLFLITGIAWMVVSLIVLRFDYTSVSSIALLFGFVALAAGVAEIGMVFLAQGWWKVLNKVLAVAFITAAIVAFVHPGNTFRRWPRCSASCSSSPARRHHLRDLGAARERFLVVAAGRRDHRACARSLGSRLPGSKRHPARRLGSGVALIRASGTSCSRSRCARSSTAPLTQAPHRRDRARRRPRSDAMHPT